MKPIKDWSKANRKKFIYLMMFVICLEGVAIGMIVESIVEIDIEQMIEDEVFILMTGAPKLIPELTHEQICDTFVMTMYSPLEAKEAFDNGLGEFCTPSEFIQSLIDVAEPKVLPFGDGGFVVAP